MRISSGCAEGEVSCLKNIKNKEMACGQNNSPPVLGPSGQGAALAGGLSFLATSGRLFSMIL